ncbi:hypothetical protein CALVIDRAFT_201925 [Calocera viscosa TUFC12733]|uniref:Uncharacterized protein n=1 Tax=Calocera viscosa (strain TUFC12733) TaxID=1330018 RepID=A0A167KAK1_CALVF|nr:hypothetical protein CALVIDRAFT_201925 [Calocera viscosa TUFC12733]
MTSSTKDLFYAQKIDNDGIFHVDYRHPDGSIVHFSESLDSIIGVSGRKATNGQTGFFSSKLTADIRLDAKEPWKIHYRACSAESKNDWSSDTYDLLNIIDFTNNAISFKKQTVLVQTHTAQMTKETMKQTKESSNKNTFSEIKSTKMSTGKTALIEQGKETAAAKVTIHTKKEALASQNRTVAELKRKVASMEAYIKQDTFKDAKDRAKHQHDLHAKSLELKTARMELGGLKGEVEKLRDLLAAEEADDLMADTIHELKAAETNLQLESAQAEIDKLKSTVRTLEGYINEDAIEDAIERSAHMRAVAELKHTSELEVGFARTKAEMEEAREITTAYDRLQIESKLQASEARLAEQDRTISARVLNVGKTYGDYAHLNGEIKERDIKMALMYQDASDMYRELSFAHERFSSVDMERLAMKEEQKRAVSEYSGLKHDLVHTTMKFERLTAEYRKQEAALKQTLEEKIAFEHKCTTLEAETDQLRKELLALRLQNADLKAERTSIRTKFEKAETTILGQEVIIKHSEAWKALYEQQVQTLRKELADSTIVMAELEESYRKTITAFRTTQAEKEKLQSELIQLKYSKTAVDARVVVVEQALQTTRAELSQLSKSYEQKDDELRAMAGIKAVLERRLSDLSLTHSHERNVTRNLSERLVHVQGNMAENVDWIYDMRQDLSEESKYLYLHYLHNGGAVGLGLRTPPLSRLPSYGSAVNSRSGSPAKERASMVEASSSAVGMNASLASQNSASTSNAVSAAQSAFVAEKSSSSQTMSVAQSVSSFSETSSSQSTSAQTTSVSQIGSVSHGHQAVSATAISA